MNRILTIAAAATALGFGLVPISAHAQQNVPSVTTTIISLDGKQIMDIRTGAGGYAPWQRADAVRVRLQPILAHAHLYPSDVTVRPAGQSGDEAIYVRGSLLVTVDAELARANDSKPNILAQTWANRLRFALPQSNALPNPNGV